MTIDELVKKCHSGAVDRGFWDIPDKLDPMIQTVKIARAHSELSEAFEEIKKVDTDYAHLMEELADTIITVCDMAGSYDWLSLEEAINKKLGINNKRPYRHGGRL